MQLSRSRRRKKKKKKTNKKKLVTSSFSVVVSLSPSILFFGSIEKMSRDDEAEAYTHNQ